MKVGGGDTLKNKIQLGKLKKYIGFIQWFINRAAYPPPLAERKKFWRAIQGKRFYRQREQEQRSCTRQNRVGGFTLGPGSIPGRGILQAVGMANTKQTNKLGVRGSELVAFPAGDGRGLSGRLLNKRWWFLAWGSSWTRDWTGVTAVTQAAAVTTLDP